MEPVAALLAAFQAKEERRARLIELAEAMERSGREQQPDVVVQQDVEFHTTLLAASHNEMFIAPEMPVTEALTGRHRSQLMPQEPLPSARDAHYALALRSEMGEEKTRDPVAVAILDSVLRETDAPSGVGDDEHPK